MSLLGSMDPHQAFWLPPVASNIARQSDPVMISWIVLSVLITTLIAGVIFYFGYKYRKGSKAERWTVDLATAHKIEVGWIVPTAIAFFAFFFWGGWVYYVAYTPPQKDVLRINCVGKQWMWKFQHPDGVLEINDLHVPVGKKVVVTITSEDVVHSLGIPAFRVKRDAIPGTYTQLWFIPTEAGRFHLTCNQYCGLDHSLMRGSVFAMEPATYQSWLAKQHPARNLVSAGRVLYKSFGCAACHGAHAAARAPSLIGLFGSTITLKNGRTVVADESYLRDSIVDPNKEVVAGYKPIMPSYKGQIDEEGLFKMLAYLKSLTPPTRENP